jgi:hypothetical protein
LHGKGGIIRAAGVVCDTTTTRPPDKAAMATYIGTFGTRDRFNIYFVDIIAIARVLQNLSTLPSSLITEPSQYSQAIYPYYRLSRIPQSGQSYICQIYIATCRLAQAGNLVLDMWTPAQEHIYLMEKAKAKTNSKPTYSGE